MENGEFKMDNKVSNCMKFRYRTDEEMKDSGIEYIGKIPNDWIINPVKYLVNPNEYYPIGDGDHGSIKPEMYQTNGIPYIRVQNLTWSNKLDFNGMVYINEKVNNDNKKSILKPKDILIAKTGATVGKTAIIPQNITQANTTSSVGKVTVDHEKFNYKYVAYYFQSRPFITQINFTAYQKSAQPGFNIDDLVQYKVSLPKDIYLQNKIAKFLDVKTYEFDSIISKKEALIEKLEEAKKSLISEVVTGKVKVIKTEEGYKLIKRKKEEMKNCGVEWFEEIPKEWKYSKLKYLTNQIIDGSHSTPNYVESGVPFLRVTDITNNKKVIDLNNVKYISIEEHKELIKRCKPEKGDLLVSKNGTIGVTKVVDWDWEFSTFVSLCLIKIKKELLVELLSYFFKSDILDEQIAYGGKKTSITNLHLEKIREFVVPVPKLNEQILIIEYLNIECNKLDKTINKILLQIENLKEAKQSLISEAVTGKIEVLD